MVKVRSNKRPRLNADQRRVRRYQIFFVIVTAVVLLSMLLSLVK
jgi:predicted nucleic acid-binding Zn ribbon protein